MHRHQSEHLKLRQDFLASGHKSIIYVIPECPMRQLQFNPQNEWEIKLKILKTKWQKPSFPTSGLWKKIISNSFDRWCNAARDKSKAAKSVRYKLHTLMHYIYFFWSLIQAKNVFKTCPFGRHLYFISVFAVRLMTGLNHNQTENWPWFKLVQTVNRGRTEPRWDRTGKALLIRQCLGVCGGAGAWKGWR